MRMVIGFPTIMKPTTATIVIPSIPGPIRITRTPTATGSTTAMKCMGQGKDLTCWRWGPGPC